MKYIPYDSSKHALDIGTNIRLAGRDGRILWKSQNIFTRSWWYDVCWNDQPDCSDVILLEKVSGLEIAIPIE
jgi:hypothetical protein